MGFSVQIPNLDLGYASNSPEMQYYFDDFFPRNFSVRRRAEARAHFISASTGARSSAERMRNENAVVGTSRGSTPTASMASRSSS